jgi:hypothetical protein
MTAAVAQVAGEPDDGDAAAYAVGVGALVFRQRGLAFRAVEEGGEAFLRIGDDFEVGDEQREFFVQRHGGSVGRPARAFKCGLCQDRNPKTGNRIAKPEFGYRKLETQNAKPETENRRTVLSLRIDSKPKTQNPKLEFGYRTPNSKLFPQPPRAWRAARQL